MLNVICWTVAESVRALRDLAAQLEPDQPEIAQQLYQIAANLATPVRHTLEERVERATAHPVVGTEAMMQQDQLTLQVLGETRAAGQVKADQLFHFLVGENSRLRGEAPPLVEALRQIEMEARQQPAKPSIVPASTTPE